MDIKGVNYLMCDRKDCAYNIDNECQCMTVFLNENGVCNRVKHGPVKRYKVISHKKRQVFKPMVNINLSEEEINEITQKLTQELQRNPLTIMPEHIEDNIYYMSSGLHQNKDRIDYAEWRDKNDNFKSK